MALFQSALIQAQRGALAPIDLFSLAESLTSANQADCAVRLYQAYLTNKAPAMAYIAYFNLGVLLRDMGNHIAAELAYRQAIHHKTDFIQAHFALGSEFERRGSFEAALSQWRIILDFDEDILSSNKAMHLLTLNSMGRLLETVRQFREAERMLEQSLLLDIEQPDVIHHWIHLRQKQCAWPLFSALPGLSKEKILNAASALTMLNITDDPEIQLDAARKFVKKHIDVKTDGSLAPPHGYHHSKLRIGYLSSDFCTHPVSLLTVELFELHDRTGFDIYGFCYTPEKNYTVGNVRERVINAMDHFVCIGEMTDEVAARCIRAHEVDILVDLQGLTAGVRPNILSYRPAPVQLTYLGFPGTTALPDIDYVIADRFLVPETLTPFFTEKPLYMPHVFQVSDRKRKIGIKPSRADCNLPENTFVFCSFNNNYKFTAEMFSCWMRILVRVPNSVLWLLADNPWAQQNMCDTAKKNGVAIERLIFASRVSPADYLARYQIADLFLDTFPFNAGTTANDALWAGLPLLTLAGRTFASRMAGSLLNSLGLHELITGSLQDYEEQAIRLATHREQLAGLRAKLEQNRANCQLYDMPQMARDFENLLKQVAVGLSSFDKSKTIGLNR
jgi:predicted O-linked N-acetylglucosamine transferase (SPINDLY family)